jgi:hypothetical protein
MTSSLGFSRQIQSSESRNDTFWPGELPDEVSWGFEAPKFCPVIVAIIRLYTMNLRLILVVVQLLVALGSSHNHVMKRGPAPNIDEVVCLMCRPMLLGVIMREFLIALRWVNGHKPG